MKCEQAHGVNHADKTVNQTWYAVVVLRMGDISNCCKQSVALGNIWIPRVSSMLIGTVLLIDGFLQFSSWGTMLILDARASTVRCND